MIGLFRKWMAFAFIVASLLPNLSEALTKLPAQAPLPVPIFSARPFPSPLPISTPLKQCQEITTPGNYSLEQDLSTTEKACLFIHSTKNVNLNCDGHTISGATAISAYSMQNITIQNCTLLSDSSIEDLSPNPTNNPDSDYVNAVVNVTESSNITISNNTIGKLGVLKGFANSFTLALTSDSTVVVNDNNIYAYLDANYMTQANIHNNNFVNPLPLGTTNYLPASVVLNLGGHNVVSLNTMDGRWVKSAVGVNYDTADDGVDVDDEMYDTVENNFIQNYFDCGVEFTGNDSNHIISGNVIQNIGNFGIGGWYWLSLTSSSISNNLVTNSGHLFGLYRIFGLRAANWDGHGIPADTGVYFENNTFANNVFSPSSYSGGTSGLIPLSNYLDYSFGYPGGYKDITKSQFHITKNVFTNNDFNADVNPFDLGISSASQLVAGQVVDGGDNVCTTVGSPLGSKYPLVCNQPKTDCVVKEGCSNSELSQCYTVPNQIQGCQSICGASFCPGKPAALGLFGLPEPLSR
jgi:hypothetical protein